MDFLKQVKSPPHAYSPAAFWFWYGELEAKKLCFQIDEMVDKGVYNAFMHSRAYLKTPYLEQGWWDAVSACVEHSRQVGFHPWLYDEYAWPSGTAGSTFEYGFQKPSRTLAKGECNMAKSLAPRRFPSAAAFREEAETPIAAFILNEESGWLPLQMDGDGEILAFYRKVHKSNVDYMNKETIRLFLELTHEQYRARYGEDFGGLIPGIFFDEIYMRPDPFPWTDSFPEEFRTRRGYDLLPVLPALAVPGGEKERGIRRDYYKTVTELYEEAFFIQISEWCERYRLKLTGHTEEHLGGHPGRQGNYFDTIRHLQIPGADNHDYRYRFPRKITYCEPKYAVSVARIYQKERAMSEAMGGAGWGCSLQQFKRGINTMGAMGISMFTLHGFYYACEMQGSQGDWPTSFFYQNPYWRYFRKFADYISRICYMNAQGRPVVDAGLYYPIEEIQAETVNGRLTPAGAALNRAFHEALGAMLEHQMDTDMIDSRSILAAQIRGGTLCVGEQRFRSLLLPEIFNPSAELAEKLAAFQAGGGILLRYACLSEGGSDGNCIPASSLPAALAQRMQPDVSLVRGSRSDLFVSHRIIEGKDCYFVTNSSPAPRFVTLKLRVRGGVSRLSPEDGSLSPATAQPLPDGILADLWLEADEACWLIADRDAVQQRPVPPETREQLAVAGRWEFLPLEKDCEGAAQLTCRSSRLQVPLARFASGLHPESVQIRISNMAGQDGFCGRHLSLWSGCWLGRRPAWQDDCTKPDLYFRREFTLPAVPQEARLCIASIGGWTLWVNGKKAASCPDGSTPCEEDLTQLLQNGPNLLAVHLHHAHPLGDCNLNSVETLPPDRIPSLLAELHVTCPGETVQVVTDAEWAVCDQAAEGWETPAFHPEVHEVDPASCSGFGEGPRAGCWLRAWERGRPPMLPWGDLPLFGRRLSFPQALCYTLTLPAGTAVVHKPAVAGEDFRAELDGMPVRWEADSARLTPDGLPHILTLRMTARSERDGLLRPVEAELTPFRTALFDWRLHGLNWFSGFGRYRNTVRISKRPGRYLLDLGQTAFQAEVWVNGAYADARVWAPYRYDITELLRDGENEIAVIAANSAAVERQYMLVDEGMALGWNRYWNEDNIQREGENLVSGLLGPVQILYQN